VERFTSAPADARKLIEAARGDQASGVLATDDRSAVNLAAWFLVSSAILNLDETITKE
jgi:hypothetical protein